MAKNYSRNCLKEYATSVDLFAKLRGSLLDNVRSKGVESNSLIALKGSDDAYIYDTDTTYELYYESFSFHVTGITEGNFIVFIEIDNGAVHIFVPTFNDTLRTFLVPLTPESINEKFGYNAYYMDKLPEILSLLNPSCIYLNKGTNTDSGSTIPWSFLSIPELSAYKSNDSLLYEVFAKTRSIKLNEEVEIMRRIIKASSEAHVENMKFCKPGKYEYSLAGTFRSHISTNYGYIYAFCPIAASGNSASVLHYPFMDKEIKDGDIVLCDMGGYAYGWCSDIACTFPANGKFTEKQAAIYNIVLNANRSVIKTMRPGVEWTDMHLLAEKIIIEGLINVGILKGDLEEMQNKRVGAVFFPHGLGHFLGHDTHDVGGYICGHSRSQEPGLKCLRTRRVLEENMIITVEPGCYFIDFAIDLALNNPEIARFFTEVINEYRGFGGVRIEDDVLVTRDGGEILTDVPRTVQEIEIAMAGGDWRLV